MPGNVRSINVSSQSRAFLQHSRDASQSNFCFLRCIYMVHLSHGLPVSPCLGAMRRKRRRVSWPEMTRAAWRRPEAGVANSARGLRGVAYISFPVCSEKSRTAGEGDSYAVPRRFPRSGGMIKAPLRIHTHSFRDSVQSFPSHYQRACSGILAGREAWGRLHKPRVNSRGPAVCAAACGIPAWQCQC